MTHITAIGEILIDLTQSGVNANGVVRFDANPGGAPANLAVAAARLGARTAFVGKVGQDGFGVLLRRCLEENGVDTQGLAVDPVRHTTLAVVTLDEKGERSFSFYRDFGADVNLTEADVPAALLLDTRFLHFGSVSLTAQPARDTTLSAVRRAKTLGALISYDPNYRPSLWPDEATAVAQMREPLPLVDVLKVSDEELSLLTGSAGLESGTALLAEQGVPLVLVTLGADGAFYRFRNRMGHVPGIPCTVGDTNGAGDAFFGAVLARLSRLEGLEALDFAALEKILVFANKTASLTVSRHGAIPAMPSLEEVLG